MVIWLLNKDNLEKVIPELSNWIDLINKAYDKDYIYFKDRIEKIRDREVLSYNKDYTFRKYKEFQEYIPEIKIQSEKPIMGNNNFIMGYWDVVVEIGSSLKNIVECFFKLGFEDDTKLGEVYIEKCLVEYILKLNLRLIALELH